MVVVIVGRSCSGKTEAQKELCKRSRYRKAVTCTTRSPRPGEVDGVHYYFLSREDFIGRIAGCKFVETTEYAGNLYGTLRKDLEGDDIKVLVLEPGGAAAVKEIMGDKALLVYLFVDAGTSYEALRNRGDNEYSIELRMKEDEKLFGRMEDIADYILDNSGFELSPKEVADAIHRAAYAYF